jgi:hypothetical protein
MRLVNIVVKVLDATQILICNLLRKLREQNSLIFLFGCYSYFKILVTLCCDIEKEWNNIPDKEYFILVKIFIYWERAM